MLCAQ